MLWTNEAVGVLKRLALEGRSASVIAAALGAPSRNAVIGKANRIGVKLNGDGRASMAGRMEAGFPLQLAEPRIAARPPKWKAGWSFAEAEVLEMRCVGLEDIRRSSCRWPVGDPMSQEFAYCGLEVAKGRSYCAGHCRMAYQPPKARARRDWRDQRRSWGQ